MQRMSLPWFLGVVSAIDELPQPVFGEKQSPSQWVLHNARNQLEALFSQSIYSPYLRASRERAGQLASALNSMILKVTAEPPAEVSDYDVWYVSNERDQFKTVFLAELSILPSFLVAGKESYETNFLIDEGTRLFPASLSAKVPEAVPDAKEVGRSLAFELATACGFHIFRVSEAVVKRYWDCVSKEQSRPSLETLGNYASEMEKKKFGDQKVIEALKQMTKLHRNPLIHPEVILTVEEAIETLGIARSVIGAMLRTLPDVPPTTTTAIATT